MRDLFVVLLRHFFGRFFDNELVSGEGDTTASFSKIIGAVAAPGLVCFWLMPKYTVLAYEPAAVAEAASLPDKLLFLTFSMAIMGFVTVLEWDALFPDRRDFTILIPLPLRLESIFTAKIVSLLAFVVVFFAASNAISIFLYPFIAMRGTSTFLSLLNLMFVHAGVTLAATSFVFFFFVALQGLLLNVLSFRAFKRVSTFIQLTAVFALLMMLLLSFDPGSILHSGKHRDLLCYFPPMWFLGLYESLLHQPEPLPGSAAIAVRALWLTIGVSALAYLLA